MKSAAVISVDGFNVGRTGFFCYMSKRKSEGFRRKLDWVKKRLDEGMRIKMLELPERGFIEYIPGEYAWRAVNADGFMVIHCLWVVGKSKGKGFGALLLDECVRDARKAGLDGVAMVTSEGNWLAGKKLLLRQGFEPADEAPPSFTLMVKKFKKTATPSFPKNWEERLKKLGRGLTILRTDQCPYIPLAARILTDAARELGIKTRMIEIKSRFELLKLSPTPYGVFHVVSDGRLLGYHYLAKEDFIQLLR